MVIHHLPPGASILEEHQKNKSSSAGNSAVNFGFGYQLENVNELVRNDVEELVTSRGVNMISLSPSKLSNLELLQTFRRIEELGCVVRVVLSASDMVMMMMMMTMLMIMIMIMMMMIIINIDQMD